MLRTCPQTTGIPTNPVCNQPATRPQLQQTFCVACAHIQHKRWNDIAEQEHRWMHERGACGCPVKFPDMMQPRMIVGGGRRGSYGILSPDGTTCTVYGGGGSTPKATENHHYQHHGGSSKKGSKRGGGKNWRRGGGGGNGGGGYNHHSYAQQASRAQQQKDEYPPMQEIREGNEFRYAVRLPSTYGIEWAWDHEKLHRDGKCFCNVRFDKYAPQYNLPPNTQDSSVQQSSQNTGAADGSQNHNATSSNNDFLTTRPFGQSTAQPDSQWSAAQPSGAQSSSMQPWAQPFAQSSGQGYSQTSTAQTNVPQTPAATQGFATQQQSYPQYPTQNPPRGHEYSGSSAQTYEPNYTQDSRDPFSPSSMNDFSQTVPDSLAQLFPTDNSSNDVPLAPPAPPPYTMPRVPLDDVNSMPTWNPAQPQRWTCNPPTGYYNTQEVYLPPALPGLSTVNANTNVAATAATTTSSAIHPPIAHGTNIAATSSGTGNGGNKDKGKGKAKANNGDNDGNNTASTNATTTTATPNTTTYIDDSTSGIDIGFGNPPRPVDMQTMWFGPDQAHSAHAPIVGLPIGQGPEGPDGAVQRAGQTFQHPQHMEGSGSGSGKGEGAAEKAPLNGFPIGAGPEGDAHAGPFEECPLYNYHRGAGEYGRGLRRPESSFL